MEILEAWESFSRAMGCAQNRKMRAAFLAGYVAGSARQLMSADENHQRTTADLHRLVEVEIASAKPTGATQ